MFVLFFVILALVVGVVIGTLITASRIDRAELRRVHERNIPPRPMERRLPAVPICGCGHAMSFHDPEHPHKQCRYTASKKYTKMDSKLANKVFGGYWDIDYCACLKYIGPEPVPDFMALEM